MSRWLTVLLVVTACVATPTRTPTAAPSAVRIDHVIIGVAHLEAGLEAVERLTGVRPALGGSHPGRGTRNALMSLGDGIYLELLAPDPAQRAQSPELGELRRLERPTPVGWAIAADDVPALRAQLTAAGLPTSAPEAGSRIRPDGSRLDWVTFGFEGARHPLAPFFIRWQRPDLHPSRTSPRGCVLVALTLRDPAPERLRDIVRTTGVPVEVAPGTEPPMAVAVNCPRGLVTLR